MQEESHSVNFRISRRYRERLLEEAEKHKLSSHHLAARKLVLDSLDRGDVRQLTARVAALEDEVREFRDELKSLRGDLKEAFTWTAKSLQSLAERLPKGG